MKTAVEYRGCIYRLRSDLLKGKLKDLPTHSNVNLYLDVYNLSDHGSASSTLNILSSTAIPYNGSVFKYYIEVVENSEQVKVPLIVLITERQPLSFRSYAVDVTSSRINPLRNCTVTNQHISFDCNFRFLPGPTFFSVTADSRLYFKTLLGKDCASIEINDIDRVFYIKSFYNPHSYHFSYLAFVKNKVGLSCYVLCLSRGDCNFLKARTINIDYFVPESYSEFLTSVYIDLHIKFKNSIKCGKNNCCNFVDAFTNNYTCVCTTQKQFLIFVSGMLRYKCSVPFADINSISCIKLCEQYQVSFLLISNVGVALVQKDNDNSLIKVSKTWEGVSSIYYGDFYRCGKPILLLLHDSSFPKTITNFTVAEIPGLGSTTEKGFQGMQESCEFINTMVNALEKRVSTGQASLNHAEESFQDKQRVLNCAVRTLDEYTRTGCLGASYQDVSLVDVALGFQLAPPCEPEPSHTKPDPIYLKLLSEWQTTYRDHWVLGWTFVNSGPKIIFDITGTLFAGEQVLQVSQKVFLHPSAQFISQPTLDESSHLSRHVSSKRMVSLLLALEIPVSSRNSTDMNAVVSYYVSVEGTGSFLQQVAFLVPWKISDMSTQWEVKFKTLSAVQQLMCYHVLQAETTLEVKSQLCPLSGPDPGVLAKAGVKAPALLQPQEGTTTFVFGQIESPLSGLNFTWHAVEENSAKVNVHFKSPNQLMIFVHWLYEFLAREASVLPAPDPDLSPVCLQIWDAMSCELGKSLTAFRRKVNAALKRQAPGARSSSQAHKGLTPWSLTEYVPFRKEITDCETDTDNMFRNLFGQ